MEQANLIIDLEIANNRFNRVIAEHTSLVQRYRNLLAQRETFKEQLVDSFITRPYVRLQRDATALEAAAALDLATQATYLAAKAYEYETLSPLPYIHELYRVRNPANLRSFLDRLQRDYIALPQEQFSKREYRLSLARDILGLTDEYLDPDGTLTPAQLEAARAAAVQEFLIANRYTVPETGVDKIAYPFTTTIDNPRFLRGVFNNRISRISSTDPGCSTGCRGLWLNLVTDQDPADFGGSPPQIKLTHGGHSTYRDGLLREVSYTPGPALMVGRTLPAGFGGESRASVMTAHLNLGVDAEPNRNFLEDGFYNLSIATSQWIAEIDLTNPTENTQLDITKIRDVEIRMDTTYVTPAFSRQLVAMETHRLDAEQVGLPVPSEVQTFLAQHEQEQAQPRTQDIPHTSDPPAVTLQQTGQQLGYPYRGQIFVTEPVNLGTKEIGFTLAINPDNTVVGRLCDNCTPLFDTRAAIRGTFDPATQRLDFNTARFPATVNGRTVERQFAFTGTVAIDPTDGTTFSGTYTETLTGLTPVPLITSGDILLSRIDVQEPIVDVGPAITISPLRIRATEGGEPGVYSVVLNSRPNDDVTVTITPDTQTTVAPTQLTFTALSWDAPQTIDVVAIRDTAVEGEHTGVIRHNASSNDPSYRGLSLPNVTVTIRDAEAGPADGPPRLYLPIMRR